ncbi:hypothetical protein [Intestinimonas butyriciproducens]|uniref:hypothetical protein n=1 Tax=Intestinimonas butyriciproducens TaxID=1297617 RepID=UPI0013EDB919|nr:hypothetical protein [Intestinimonas butyriciproducens]MCI6362864.1 hypothetical protein [Intestinimonas butyriciproducens]MCR1906278.1 hypothetical protein [Intestinimonas butyriciproducens]
MRRNKVRAIHVHIVPSQDGAALTEKIYDWQIRVIERRLNEAGLSTSEKLTVIDAMMADLSSGNTAKQK